MGKLEERFNQAGEEIARHKRQELAKTLVEVCEGNYEDILELIEDAEDQLIEKTEAGPDFLVRIEAQKILARETLEIFKENIEEA